MLYIKFYNEDRFSHSVARKALKAKVVETISAEDVLVLSPHPDDDIFGCGGLLSQLAESGAKIKVIYFNDGATGNKDGQRDYDLVAQREDEAVRALRMIGVHEVNFLRIANLAKKRDLWEKIFEELKTRHYDLALVPNEHDWHCDHQIVARAYLKSISRRLTHKPITWYYAVWGIPSINRILPIDHSLAIKKEAISCYKSQLKVKPYDEAILAQNEYIGKALGAAKHAEGYFEK